MILCFELILFYNKFNIFNSVYTDTYHIGEHDTTYTFYSVFNSVNRHYNSKIQNLQNYDASYFYHYFVDIINKNTINSYYQLNPTDGGNLSVYKKYNNFKNIKNILMFPYTTMKIGYRITAKLVGIPIFLFNLTYTTIFADGVAYNNFGFIEHDIIHFTRMTNNINEHIKNDSECELLKQRIEIINNLITLMPTTDSILIKYIMFSCIHESYSIQFIENVFNRNNDDLNVEGIVGMFLFMIDGTFLDNEQYYRDFSVLPNRNLDYILDILFNFLKMLNKKNINSTTTNKHVDDFEKKLYELKDKTKEHFKYYVYISDDSELLCKQPMLLKSLYLGRDVGIEQEQIETFAKIRLPNDFKDYKLDLLLNKKNVDKIIVDKMKYIEQFRIGKEEGKLLFKKHSIQHTNCQNSQKIS